MDHVFLALLIATVAVCGNAEESVVSDAFLSKLDKMLTSMEAEEHVGDSHVESKRNVACGAIITSQSGEISSPGYPGTYQPNLDCPYTIQVLGTVTLSIRFTFLDVEYEGNCGYDRIVIPQSNGQEYRVCGTSPSGKQYSIPNVSGQYTIRFVTDYNTEGRGFSLHYEFVNAANVQPQPTGVGDLGPCQTFVCQNFCEAGFHQPCSDCTCATRDPYAIYPKCGVQPSCTCGYRTDSNGCPICACATQQAPPSGMVTAHNTCNMVLTENSGSFASPRFPNTVPSTSTICTTTIRTSPSMSNTVYLNFRYMNLQDSVNCVYESVSFSNTKICGFGPRSYTIPQVTGDFVVTFSGPQHNHDGFYVDFQVTGAYGPQPQPGYDYTFVIARLNDIYTKAQESMTLSQRIPQSIQEIATELQNYGYNGNYNGNHGNYYGGR